MKKVKKNWSCRWEGGHELRDGNAKSSFHKKHIPQDYLYNTNDFFSIAVIINGIVIEAEKQTKKIFILDGNLSKLKKYPCGEENIILPAEDGCVKENLRCYFSEVSFF